MVNPTHTSIILALDVMGGDHAPRVMLAGAAAALKRQPSLRFILCGDERKIIPILQDYAKLARASEIRHTDDVIGDDEKVSTALRRGKTTSMGQAIRAVRRSEAHAAVSGGNTGVLMAMSKLMLRTLPGIERPAIGTIMPHKKGRYVMLDLGANVHCDASNLFEFAVMGDAFARSLLELQSPKIGLLNIGSEDMKGNDAVRAAAEMLKEAGPALNFQGYIEGDDIADGVVDVVVTDGFTGNVALKTMEGTASMCANWYKKALTGNPLSWLGTLFLLPSLLVLKKRTDPRKYNGGVFLGLNGVVVKSHGGTDEVGCANAIDVAFELVAHDINQQITREMVESGHILPDDELLDELVGERA